MAYRINTFHILDADVVYKEGGESKDFDRIKPNFPKRKDTVAIVSAIEKKLLEIWSQVLNNHSISNSCKFVELGGKGLDAVQIVAKIQEAFSTKSITVKDIYRQETVQNLARCMEQNANSIFPGYLQ